MSFTADRKSAAIGPGSVTGSVAGAAPAGASVLLACSARTRTTPVAGGENASRTAVDTNAVEAVTTLGAWDGKSGQLPDRAARRR